MKIKENYIIWPDQNPKHKFFKFIGFLVFLAFSLSFSLLFNTQVNFCNLNTWLSLLADVMGKPFYFHSCVNLSMMWKNNFHVRLNSLNYQNVFELILVPLRWQVGARIQQQKKKYSDQIVEYTYSYVPRMMN